ncbi:MAG: DUF3267 domain-containing protein [Clostridia bacterium]|nr:DUF3267 domain-containing protein [Clostridia bacterium]
MAMTQSHEKELPQGYEEKYSIDAGDKKTGLIFNVVGLSIMAFVAVIVICTAPPLGNAWVLLWQMLLLLAAIVVYTVLHEIVHGIAYKVLTKEKLTFGIKWSCAFCGVPNIYIYRKTALTALLAPFVLFSILLIPTAVVFGVFSSFYYLPTGLLFGFHLGGCCGDLYMTGVLVFKYRDKDVLLRDTGPKQWIYVKN